MHKKPARSEKGYTFDTNVGINICKNPNFGSLLACRLSFKDRRVHVCSRTIFEITNNGYGTEQIKRQIEGFTGTAVVMGAVTNAMMIDARGLERRCSTLHEGDSQILAYARATDTILITSDKNLIHAAKDSRCKAINPDTLSSNRTEKVRKPRLEEMARREATKPPAAKPKKTPLQPGHTIVWQSFIR